MRTQTPSDDQTVVLSKEAWADLVDALAKGDLRRATLAAIGAPVAEETFVLRETDVLAAQGLFSYAANIRTAVEFTEANGLCVMTDDVRSRLSDIANDVVQLGCDWEERRAAASATIQPSDYGIVEP